MYLDWICDTGMYGSQSESYSNHHTNGIPEIQRISIQACSVHDCRCLIFISDSTAQWQLTNNGISKPVCLHHPFFSPQGEQKPATAIHLSWTA